MKSFSRFGIEVCKNNVLEGAIYGVACTYAFLEKIIANHLRPYNLTPAKFNAMMIIKHMGKDKGISQVDIGRRLIVTASNMTRLLDKLEKEALIERLSLAGDRRVNLIKISKKGSDLLDRAWPEYYKKIQELAKLLSQDELRKVTYILDKWCGKISV
jgi:DNA-binding MarR family transcriptional regulator